MEKEIILKKAVVGGFDRVQVMNCIASLQEKANNAKNEAEELNSLKATLAELEQIISEKDAEIESLSASVAEAESKALVSKTSAQLMKESVDYADHYVRSAKILAQDITEKTSERVRDANEKIDSILLDITRLSNDILALYTNLADLKSEYDSFGDIYTSASSENYLAEDEGTVVKDGNQVCSPSAAQKKESSAPLKDEDDALELIRKTKKKYQRMVK